ncbi:hypothetical protein EV184_11663 [Sinorhizobium americanum]|uniref:Uncharacterized protein n=1 Tax=Sinorhizobium americanum TaxID=194963 RepID=A0A4R2BLB5_9HYPH|nr:hypothetical protein EV184_11663 [Sinorhizobium americanum]
MLQLNQKCTFATLPFGVPENQGFERHGLRLQDISGKFRRLSVTRCNYEARRRFLRKNQRKLRRPLPRPKNNRRADVVGFEHILVLCNGNAEHRHLYPCGCSKMEPGSPPPTGHGRQDAIEDGADYNPRPSSVGIMHDWEVWSRRWASVPRLSSMQHYARSVKSIVWMDSIRVMDDKRKQRPPVLRRTTGHRSTADHRLSLNRKQAHNRKANCLRESDPDAPPSFRPRATNGPSIIS